RALVVPLSPSSGAGTKTRPRSRLPLNTWPVTHVIRPWVCSGRGLVPAAPFETAGVVPTQAPVRTPVVASIAMTDGSYTTWAPVIILAASVFQIVLKCARQFVASVLLPPAVAGRYHWLSRYGSAETSLPRPTHRMITAISGPLRGLRALLPPPTPTPDSVTFCHR